jgi:hypothetical protein
MKCDIAITVAAPGFLAPGANVIFVAPLAETTLFWRPLPLAPGGNCPLIPLRAATEQL